MSFAVPILPHNPYADPEGGGGGGGRQGSGTPSEKSQNYGFF